MSNKKCYVLIKQGYYWREKAGGYTSSILEAGRYTSEEADKYVYPKREISKRKIPACEWVTKHHLSEFSEGREMLKQEAELATLRAKATAYEIGMERWCVFSDKGTPIKFFPDQYLWEEPQYASLRKIGFTCRKVKICEVVG